jgi:fumarylacetoacetase
VPHIFVQAAKKFSLITSHPTLDVTFRSFNLFIATVAMTTLNETHDPALTSWLASANDSAVGFPLQHLPFAVFRKVGSSEAFRPGVALGDQIIDLARLADAKPFSGMAAEALNTCTGTTLNALMALGNARWSALRLALSRAVRTGSALQAV